MVRAFLRPQERDGHVQVTLVDASTKKPAFATSHQVFHEALQLVEPGSETEAFESISFVLHNHSVPAFQSLHTVFLTEASGEYRFKPQRQVPTKQTVLPFGLKDSPRKRKSKPKSADAAGQPKAKRPRSSTKPPCVGT